ncbi:hypothetical protein SAMN05216184_10834 [Georgenia satyanarayanai]|uniref:Fibronectin type-III domain-containing protein n=1 Tax=Georgenia satyanarayanai TaxID=860221 RepID=A0A2Y9AG31_9MICO|nr:hypothetical protein [Georgenia satyanarayanai]PYF99152.1 hypothetical protein A8987_10834 [Georgenia satyanarayanai]SSA43270.1 hypothetical protein SAMN05216184_10834 [Georgenia satyanarayanai]
MTTRLTACLLALAVVLGGVLLLGPSESTLAAWSDETTTTVPQLRTGGVQVDVTTAGAGTTATLGMSGDTSGTWRPGAVTVTSGGRALTGAELDGSRVDYRLAGTNGTCAATDPVAYTASLTGPRTSFAVTGGERLSGARTVCLAFVPSDQVRVQLGGRTLALATTVDGAATAGAWTAASTWTATHQLPAAPSVSAMRCTSGWLNQWVTLGWDWDAGGLNQAVARWSLQLEDRGTWREVGTVPARQRTTTVSPYQFDFVNFDSYTLRVAAVLADGTTVPAPSSTRVRVERIGLGAAYCS